MVGVARIELATPAMSRQGHLHFSAENGGFLCSATWNNARTERDSAKDLPQFYRAGLGGWKR